MLSITLFNRLVLLLVIGLSTVLFMMMTQPAQLPAVLLTVPFVGIFTFLYIALYEMLRFLGPDSEGSGALLQMKRPRLMAAVLAGFPVLLLILQSVVKLTVWDVLIAFTITLLAYIYISRSSVRLFK